MGCGDELISPKDAELGMCTICLKTAQESAKKKLANLKNKNFKRIRLKVNPALVKGYKG